jgi:hypothetical protein
MFGTGIVGLGNGDENGEGALGMRGAETELNCFLDVACGQELSGKEGWLPGLGPWGSGARSST